MSNLSNFLCWLTSSSSTHCTPWALHVSWWRHQMETFSALLALCAGNSPVPVNSPHKGQWRGALMFSLICVRINDWVNNCYAGDLRRHRGHYDVIVMVKRMKRVLNYVTPIPIPVWYTNSHTVWYTEGLQYTLLRGSCNIIQQPLHSLGRCKAYMLHADAHGQLNFYQFNLGTCSPNQQNFAER